MPRGKYVNHKGRSRHFTSPEELQQESEEDSDQSSGSDKESVEKESGNAGSTNKPATRSKLAKPANRQKQTRRVPLADSDDDDDDDDEDDDSDDDSEAEARDSKKGVASLIEIENPNRVMKKATQKVSHIKIDDAPGGGSGSGAGGGAGSSSHKPELSRREREQIEKQKARQRYEKLHAAGKTTEAKADLARLALIRQQREEAAAKREAEKKAAADLSKKPLSK